VKQQQAMWINWNKLKADQLRQHAGGRLAQQLCQYQEKGTIMRNENTHYKLNNGRRLLRGLLVGWLAFCGLGLTAVATAAERTISGSIREIGPSEFVSVPLYKSKIIEVQKNVKKLSVGNPEIADILILRSNQVYVVGKSLGTTNVVLWDAGNRIISNIDIEITHDADTLKSKLHDLLPDEQIKVHSSQGAIILSGEVSGPAKMDAALALATSFAPTDEEGNVKEGKVVNLMHVGGVQQVMLEVKVAEINRTVLKTLDIDFLAINPGQRWKIGAVNGGASFPNALDPDGLLTPIFGSLTPGSGLVGPALDQFEPNPLSIDDKGLFASFLSSQLFFESVINASKNNGLAKVLAEPTLTTLSGQEATFLSGGEFPIPVPQEGGNTTIEFKEFGIGMNFVPVVLDSNKINLKVAVRVDELTSTSPVVLGVENTAEVFVIPSLRSRRASSSLELADGQTIAIAGLISDNLRENVDKFPGLGDVPVLGMLFTSEQFLKDQTELVIFVTPKMAKPIAREQMKLPTDNFVEPSELGFYLLGQMEGKKPREAVESAGTTDQAGLKGSFGHQM
jgi:pilus assembly protein CpaC